VETFSHKVVVFFKQNLAETRIQIKGTTRAGWHQDFCYIIPSSSNLVFVVEAVQKFRRYLWPLYTTTRLTFMLKQVETFKLNITHSC